MASAPLPEETSVIYPQLKAYAPQFRHEEAINIKHFVEEEVNKHLQLYKKCKRFLTILRWTRLVFVNIIVCLNAASISSLTSLIAISLALHFEIASIAAGLLMNVISAIESRLMAKLEKHDENHTLAVSALITITELLSNALDDGLITETEFKMVINERRKYIDMRNAIRTKHFHEADAQDIKKRVMEK